MASAPLYYDTDIATVPTEREPHFRCGKCHRDRPRIEFKFVFKRGHISRCIWCREEAKLQRQIDDYLEGRKRIWRKTERAYQAERARELAQRKAERHAAMFECATCGVRQSHSMFVLRSTILSKHCASCRAERVRKANALVRCAQCNTDKRHASFNSNSRFCDECRDLRRSNPFPYPRKYDAGTDYSCTRCREVLPAEQFHSKRHGRNLKCCSCSKATNNRGGKSDAWWSSSEGQRHQRRMKAEREGRRFRPGICGLPPKPIDGLSAAQIESLHSGQRRRLRRAMRADGTLFPKQMKAMRESARRCAYCQIGLTPSGGDHAKGSDATVDHLDPLALGGLHGIANVIVACRDCNSKKRDQPFVRWLEALPHSERGRVRELYQKVRGTVPEQPLML